MGPETETMFPSDDETQPGTSADAGETTDASAAAPLTGKALVGKIIQWDEAFESNDVNNPGPRPKQIPAKTAAVVMDFEVGVGPDPADHMLGNASGYPPLPDGFRYALATEVAKAVVIEPVAAPAEPEPILTGLIVGRYLRTLRQLDVDYKLNAGPFTLKAGVRIPIKETHNPDYTDLAVEVDGTECFIPDPLLVASNFEVEPESPAAPTESTGYDPSA